MEKVCDIVEESWDEVASGIEMWEVIRDSMVDVAEITLGWETRNQPDWFKEKGSRCIPETTNCKSLPRPSLHLFLCNPNFQLCTQQLVVCPAISRSQH